MCIRVETLVEDCRSAVTGHDPAESVRQILARAICDRVSLVEALGQPARGGIQTLHRSTELTVLNVVWPPNFTMMPHDHRMWAVIGIYSGREENHFYRRLARASDGRIELVDGRILSEGDAVILDTDVIHGVTNPTSAYTGAIHVYAGDFFAAARSAWDTQSLTEQPFDGERSKRLLEGTT